MVFTTEEVQTKALNEVNIEVKQGEFVAIMGPSGYGKSTLLNILGTLDSPTSGKYFFNGKEIDKMGESQLTAFRKGNIGFVFQSFNLIDELTVFENVELPLVCLGCRKAERKRKVMELLRELNGQGTTIVMVTHSERDASFAHRIIHLLDGRVVS